MSFIGSSLIGIMDKMSNGQDRMTKELSELNAFSRARDVKISRNTEDIKEIRIITSVNTSRLDKLKGQD